MMKFRMTKVQKIRNKGIFKALAGALNPG